MRKILEKYLIRNIPRVPEGDANGPAVTPTPEATSSPSPESPSSPAVEPKAPVVEGAPAVSDSGEGTGDAEGSGKTGPSATPPAAKTPPAKGKDKDWRDARIAKLTGQLQELREKVNTPPAAPAVPAPAGALDPTADFNARVAAAARQQVAINTFNDRCNAEAAKGRAQWEDFDARLADVRSLVNVSDADEVAAYNALLQAGLETGELATLMYELGQDLDEANRILALSPLRMGVELTKKALKGAQIEGVSKVPPPVRPLAGGRGEQLPVDPTNPEQADNLTTAEWMKRREAQVAARGRN